MIGGGPEGGIFKSTERRQDVDEADEGTAEGRRRAASRSASIRGNPTRVYALISAKWPARPRVRWTRR